MEERNYRYEKTNVRYCNNINQSRILDDKEGNSELAKLMHVLTMSLKLANKEGILYTQELKQRIQKVIDTWGPSGSQPSEAEYKEQMRKIRKNSVNFHGEMVLLENYSNINYTGT